jgi:glucuronokinase
MDFARELMEGRGYGHYELLDASLLPQLYLAYRTSLSEGTEVFHSDVRQRWLAKDPEVVQAMHTWACYADRGRQALLDRDSETLGRLIDANFDQRAKLYRLSEGNLDMVRAARSVGATANFAGSGGAVIGTYRDEEMYRKLQEVLSKRNVGVVRPEVDSTAHTSSARHL